MPDTDEVKKTVDLDTSGPAMDVDIPESKDETEIVEKETVKEESNVRPVVEEKSEDKTFENERETKLDQKDDTELKDYSESVQRRIAKLTKKWREAERQKDEATEYAKAQIKLREEAEGKISKLQPDFVAVTEEGIKSGIEAAQAKLAAAREANDLKAEAEALSAISEYGYKKAKLAETKIAQEAFEKQKADKKPAEINLERTTPTSQTQAPDPKASAWAERNTWFGQDSAMTYTAFDLHKKLTESEGFDPSSDEYYAEIDKRIRLEFPQKFDKVSGSGEEKRPAPTQTVASAKRSVKTGRKTVRLTPSQVAIAKKLGVPLEEYAKQLNITKEA